MARKPQPGGDRNAWGGVLNEFLTVAHETDGTVKPEAVQFAVTTEVESALSTQLTPAVEDAMASSTTLAAAVDSRVAADPVIAANTAATDRLKTKTYDVRDYVTDLTGATDMRSPLQSALNSFPAGATLDIPANVVVGISGSIGLTKRVTVTGGGELRWLGKGSGGTDQDGIWVNASGVVLDGIRIVGTASAPRYAVLVQASDFTITRCYIDNWAHGVRRERSTHWQGFIATNNIIKNIYGWGDEDGGDGIVVSGGNAVITGNIISAKPGTDPRAGIVAELLRGTSATPLYSYSQEVQGTGVVIANNVVTGCFRRAIHTEHLKDFVVANNTMYGMSWWGLMSWEDSRGSIVNNHILWTDNGTSIAPPPGPHSTPASAGAPTMSTGMYILHGERVNVQGNRVTVQTNTCDHGVIIRNATGTPGQSLIHFENNSILIPGSKSGRRALYGMTLDAETTVIRNNNIRGDCNDGIYLSGGTNGVAIISGNDIQLDNTVYACIRVIGHGRAIIHDNVTKGGTIGVVADSCTLAVIKHNTFTDAAGAVWCPSTTASYAPGNTTINISGTKYSAVTSTTLYGPA